MPLNIPPAPAGLPGTAPPPPGSAADAPPGGVPVAGSAALLFGLLLAQTVGQAAPKAPLPLTVTGKSEDKKKDKGKTPVEALTVPVSLGPLPAPPLPTPTTSLANAPKIANTGKAMDTVPAPGGELLSPQQNRVPTKSDLAPMEVSLPALPHAPVPPATSSQAVVVTAASSELPPSPMAQAGETKTVMVPPLAPVAPRPVATEIAMPLPTPPAPAQPTASAPAAVASPMTLSATVAAQPAVTVAAVLPALPSPAGLQNGPATADNQPGKNADGKNAGLPPAPAAKPTARVAAQGPVGKQAFAVQAAPGRGLPQDKPASGTSREAHTANTALPAPTPQAAPAATLSQTAATPMPPVDRTQMLAQVTHSLETMTPKVGATGPQQVTLQLHPKDWGQLHVRVLMTPTVGADGKVSTQVIAHVIAEHPAVKAALETGQGELRHTLREAGLHLDRLTVTVQAPAAGSDTSAGGSRQESRSGEGWSGAQAAPFGTTAQGGSNPGGSHASPPPVFAQGQTNRAMTQADAAEAANLDVSTVTTSMGRVDTRA